jgi:hypothetical protein
MHWLGRGWVLETVEGFGDVAGHGELDGAGTIIPGQGKATKFGAGPVSGDSV